MKKTSILIIFSLLSSCHVLKTRSDILSFGRSQKDNGSEFISKEESIESRVQNIESEILDLKKGLDELKEKTSELSSGIEIEKDLSDKRKEEYKKYFDLYKEELERLESLVLKAQGQIENLKNRKTSRSQRSLGFSQAQKDFNSGNYARSAQGYKSYLDKNPRGKYVTFSHYRIGICFEKLGQKKEARYFYKKTVKRNPHSKWGKLAKKRLKTLKQ